MDLALEALLALISEHRLQLIYFNLLYLSYSA